MWGRAEVVVVEEVVEVVVVVEAQGTHRLSSAICCLRLAPP